MSDTSLYSSLNTELHTQSIGVNAAELHGFISGILAGGNNDDSWQILLNDMMNDGMPLATTLSTLIAQLYQQTKQHLKEDDFNFQLLISDQHLFTQIDDMVGWVNHFLLGIGLVQPKLAKIKGNVGEVIHDLRQITQLGYNTDDDEKELGFAFEEILEYVRMAAILCHDEFNESIPSNTVH